jgi:hypothetical protein
MQMMLELVPLRIRQLRPRAGLWRKLDWAIRVLVHVASRIARRFLGSRTPRNDWHPDDRRAQKPEKFPPPDPKRPFVLHRFPRRA